MLNDFCKGLMRGSCCLIVLAIVVICMAEYDYKTSNNKPQVQSEDEWEVVYSQEFSLRNAWFRIYRHVPTDVLYTVRSGSNMTVMLDVDGNVLTYEKYLELVGTFHDESDILAYISSEN